ncbi:MAG: SufD family Fe-S cluster assembly protein [Candidatus Eremiobacteraeota bacterium]|nr:SufD family Fe-S cluster assembly protein [Candidatus Eremiobacteraeota bacterium]
MPPRWRHDYRSLDFTGLAWSSGRLRVPVLPPHVRGASVAGEDVSALEVENAGGIVHLGSTYLEPAARRGDPRVTMVALADAPAALGRTIVAPDADRFVALTTAFQNCGAYVDVPAGVRPPAPLQLVWASRPGEAGAIFSKVVVRVRRDARATILERHVATTESFVCGIVEIELEENAELDYVVVQQADEAARVVVRRAARCGPASRLGWHVADLGAALVRTTLETDLAAPHARCDASALFFALGFANAEFTATVEHRAPDTSSRAIVRGAASGRGQGVLRGGIGVAAGTYGARASLLADALVLSRDAYLEATPELRIDANDVAARLAATVGALSEDALFYVQSRGIARGRAERMVALAFFEPAIAGFPTEALRDEIRTALDARLDEVPETFA